jgi:hypothetical protein
MVDNWRRFNPIGTFLYKLVFDDFRNGIGASVWAIEKAVDGIWAENTDENDSSFGRLHCDDLMNYGVVDVKMTPFFQKHERYKMKMFQSR